MPSTLQQIDDATAGRVQIAVYAAIALRRDPIQLRRGATMLVAQAALVRCALFIIKLVEAFERLAADQAGDKPGFGAGERGQDIDARIQRRNPLFVHLGLLFLLLVHHFHHVPIQPGHDAHLDKLPPLLDAGGDLEG